MEIDDLDYLDDLLRGMDSKLGATVPPCLLEPIRLAAGESAAAAAVAAPPLPGLESDDDDNEADRVGVGASGAASCSTPRADRVAGQAGEAGEASTAAADPGALTGTATASGVPGDSGPPPLSPIGRRFVTARNRRLEDTCLRLKDEMSALRAIDVGLMKQFLTLYDAVEELRWMAESFDLGDSCETLSLSSSVSESIEQIHEKWMSERRRWQSTSSQNLASWRDDWRQSVGQVGRLNSTGGRRQDPAGPHVGPGPVCTAGSSARPGPGWRSLRTASALAVNSSFPEFSPLRRVSDFERQRRSSLDHLPALQLLPKTEVDGDFSDGDQEHSSPNASYSSVSYSPNSQSPLSQRKRRRSSSGPQQDPKASVDAKHVAEARPKAKHSVEGKGKGDPSSPANHAPVKKPKFLYHSKSSPSFKTQLESLQVTDTADI